MALGKIEIEKQIEHHYSHRLIYQAPYLFKEDNTCKYLMLVRATDLGRISIGRAGIIIKSIEKLVTPILIEHDIPVNPWTPCLQESSVINLGNLKADSIKELSESLNQIDKYITDFAEPFWGKNNSIEKMVALSNKLEDLLPVFSGEVDFNLITALKLTEDSSYKKRKDEFEKNQIELANYSAQYKKYPLAFKMLIYKLENGTNKPIV